MVGAAVVRVLERRQCHILTAPWPGVDLRRHDQVERWMAAEVPDAVIVAVRHQGATHIPRGHTRLFHGDRVTVIVARGAVDEVRARFERVGGAH